MDRKYNEEPEEPMAETPEDVAILYSWANLHGAKYRDFSASRREYRAQVRHRAAEELRQNELSAQAHAEAAAADAERVAREAERAARTSERFESPYDRERAMREAEDAARRASAERVEAARRAEYAAAAEAAARREEREIAEAHASAQRQAARWNDSEVRRRSLAGPQPSRVPALGGDPYEVVQGSSVDGDLPTPNRSLAYTQPGEYSATSAEREEALREEEERLYREAGGEVRRPRGFRPDQSSGIRPAYPAPVADAPVRNRINSGSDFGRAMPGASGARAAAGNADFHASRSEEQDQRTWQAAQDPSAPAWLQGGGSATVARTPSGQFTVAETLQHSRERVAARWFALKGVFEAGQEQATQGQGQKEVRTPLLAVFSLAGGVGKTSMVATLGRALSSLGEKVLLADTTSHGLMPYYFGATELKPGVVRTFSPPSGSSDAPIHLVSYDVEARSMDAGAKDALAEEIMSGAMVTQRLLGDFSSTSGWLIRRLPRLHVTVLVPVAADMNSVISLQSVEKYFQGATDEDGRPLLPYYVLNQFDASLPLHLDVREVLRRQLGDRLLPYVIRRSPAVSEALAEGMTVVDYQPDGPISEDYLNIASWLHGISAPATEGIRTTRWSER